MKLTIEVLPSGIVVHSKIGDERIDDTFPTRSVRERADFLRWLNDWMFDIGSRYDRERIYVTVKHGDKFMHNNDGDKCCICGDENV